jgi:hypothetical protein
MSAVTTIRDGDSCVHQVLGDQKGLLGLIFNKSQNKFDSDHPWSSASGRAVRAQIRSRRICQDPAKLRWLIVDLIDKEERVSIGRPHRFQLAAGWLPSLSRE